MATSVDLVGYSTGGLFSRAAIGEVRGNGNHGAGVGQQVRRRGIGSVAVDSDQPALFDVPAADAPDSPSRVMRGKNRQTWSLTASAEITILDAEAIQLAAAQATEDALVIELPVDPEEFEAETSDDEPAEDVFDALGQLIWPTDGMEELLAAGAFRLVSAISEVAPVSDELCVATWLVAVKLADVEELRRLAAEAHPAAAKAVAESLAVAWQHAVDPFEPLRSISGIAWQPGRVEVEYLPARRRNASGEDVR